MAKHDGKTEKPTPQRRSKARKEGQIPRSAEIGVAASLLVAAAMVKVFGPPAMRVMHREMTLLLSSSGTDQIPTSLISGSLLRVAMVAVVPFLAAAFTTAVVAGVAQTGLKLGSKAARPKLSNLSPKRGLARLAPATATWELVRTAAKLGLLVAVLWGPLGDFLDARDGGRDLASIVGRTLDLAWALLLRTALLLAVLAAADYLFNHRKLLKQLRMSRQEVKDEARNTEGDPLVKGQRRRRALELSRNRMLSEVATADVVVTNPTHLAVALRYRDGDAAPRVVAKGADRLAAKIRREAYRHGVLVTRDVPLARALYRRCKLGSYIPGALFEAVAVVLALAYRRYGKAAA